MLRIRDVYPGSRIRIFSIPDSGSKFFHPGPGSARKNISNLTQKIVSKLSEICSGLFIPDPDPGFWFFTHPRFRIQGSKRHRIRIRNTAYYCAILSTTGCSPLIYVDSIFRSVCGRSSWRVISSARAGPCRRAAWCVPLRVVRVQRVRVPLRAVVRVKSMRVHDPEVLENPRVKTRLIPVTCSW